MNVSMAIEGRIHQIDLDAAAAQIAVVESGVYSVLMDGRSYEARVEQSDGRVIVFIDGHRFEFEIQDPRRWSRQAGRAGIEGRSNVVAPMPGKVVRLLAAVGDTVAAGQGLLVVEAMKMQNELKAPKAGHLIGMPVREGATVAAGEVLAVIE